MSNSPIQPTYVAKTKNILIKYIIVRHLPAFTTLPTVTLKHLWTVNNVYNVCSCIYQHYKKKAKWSRYCPGVALLFHDRGTRRGWVVSSTPRPYFISGKDTVPILQETGWAPGPVWTGGKSRPRRDSITDRPARSQSLYRLSYLAHTLAWYITLIKVHVWLKG